LKHPQLAINKPIEAPIPTPIAPPPMLLHRPPVSPAKTPTKKPMAHCFD
jgi:hypothetical protein